jgi:predicted Zn-dependent protease
VKRAAAPAASLLLGFGAWTCAAPGAFVESDVAYRPRSSDYEAFRVLHPDLLEPNYLPFMVNRYRGAPGEDDILAFCRWSSEAMPLTVYVEPPPIPERMQDEFHPRDPEDYVEAVRAALAVWERELQGLVDFRPVASRRAARLEILLVAEAGPEASGDRQLLGGIRLRGACRVDGWAVEGETLAVHFEVPKLRVYLADQYGLLDPEQVQWIALHEIGHALGMRGHSPIPADLMYERVRDRIHVRGLSTEDVNSFESLYRLPNGTVFGRIPPDAISASSAPEFPSGPPRLALAPHVDPRLGFSIRPPSGWVRAETSRGMVAVDGVTWDYTASFQVIVERYPTIEAYLARYGAFYRAHGHVLSDEPITVDGRRALRTVIANPRRDVAEEIVFIESGDGRVFIVLADCPLDAAEAYRPWFRAALGTLEIWSGPGAP